jgi:hypothetical protein
VWRKVAQLCAGGLDDRSDFVVLMSGQIIHHHDVPWLQGRDEASLQIDAENLAVHRLVDDEGGGDGVVAQGGNEGGDLPVAFANNGSDSPTKRAYTAFRGKLMGHYREQAIRFFIAAAMCIFLANCGAVQQARQQTANQEQAEKTRAAKEQEATVMKACNDKLLSKEFKTYKAFVECSNPAVYAARQEMGDKHLDLVGVLLAARLVGADNLDKRKITKAEMDLQLAELTTRLNSERQRRDIANANMQAVQMQASAQQQAANAQTSAAFMQGLAALQTANRPAPTSSVDCISTGPYAMRSTTCN